MARPVILVVDDPVILFLVIRPTPSGTSTSLTVERSHSTPGRGTRFVARLLITG